MNITPSQSTLQAFGSSFATETPASQVRQPVARDVIEQPAPNVNQRVDAAPRVDAPARPEVESRPPAEASTERSPRGSQVDLLV